MARAKPALETDHPTLCRAVSQDTTVRFAQANHDTRARQDLKHLVDPDAVIGDVDVEAFEPSEIRIALHDPQLGVRVALIRHVCAELPSTRDVRRSTRRCDDFEQSLAGQQEVRAQALHLGVRHGALDEQFPHVVTRPPEFEAPQAGADLRQRSVDVDGPPSGVVDHRRTRARGVRPSS